MPKSLTTDQIMTALLTGQPIEAPQKVYGDSHTPPTPEAPQQPARERRRYETPTRQVHREWGKREQQREARAYSEEWYQTFRRWDVKVYEVAREASSGGGGAVLLTSGGTFSQAFYMVNPKGTQDITEVEVGELITTWENSPIPAQRQHGELLGRIRQGISPASLVDERGGWASPRERSIQYALAVLTLAVTLRDQEAEKYLRVLKSGVCATVLLDSEQ